MNGFELTYYMEAWTAFLNHTDAIMGLPICGAGAALMLMGWRLWKVVSILSCALVGLVLGQFLSGSGVFDWTWGAGGAFLLALFGIFLPRYAATLLGGLIGGGLAAGALRSCGATGSLQLVVTVLVFIAALAWAYNYRHQVVIVLTSVEGGLLLASGLAVMLPEVPFLYGFFHSMTATSPFMIGFFVMVPAVVGVLLQQADTNRTSSKAVQG